jgi:uncharacterized protein (DUF58 family)
MSVFVFLLVAMLLYMAWLPTIKWGHSRISCSRSFSKSVVFEGESGEMVEIVRNDSPFALPWLRLESRMSPYLRFGSQENLDVSGDMYYSSLFAPMPYQQIRRIHKVKFLRRGVYYLGSASLTAGDFLDVLRLNRQHTSNASVMVYPSILDADQIPPDVSQRLGEIANRRMLLLDPFLVRGIRPYVPGDPVRDIHWPATARTQQAQLRIRDYTTSTKLLVVLNGQFQDVQWKQQNSEHTADVFEQAVSLAASLCIRGLQMGIPTGFASNLAIEGTRKPVTILPKDGIYQEDTLLAAFAQLDTGAFWQNTSLFLNELEEYSGLDIMVLSFYDSDALKQSVEKLRQSGNQVSFHLLEGGNL